VTEHVIYAELHVRGCTAELYLNGIPLRRNVSPVQPFSAIPVHQYLIPGTNELEVVIEPGPTPSRARRGSTMKAAVGASAVARLVRYEEGQFTDSEEGERLVEIRWEGATDTQEVFPKSVAKQVALGARSGRWCWQDAPPLVLDEATHAEIEGVLGTVARGFARGDAKPVLELLEPRFNEGIRAYPVNDAATLTAELTDYVREVANEGWIVHPMRREEHDFRLVAGERMVELVNRDWRPTLRFKAPEDEEDVPYAMMLARIDGRLKVVR
jgi:hypothetical protein